MKASLPSVKDDPPSRTGSASCEIPTTYLKGLGETAKVNLASIDPRTSPNNQVFLSYATASVITYDWEYKKNSA